MSHLTHPNQRGTEVSTRRISDDPSRWPDDRLVAHGYDLCEVPLNLDGYLAQEGIEPEVI